MHALVGRLVWALPNKTAQYGQCSNLLARVSQPGDIVRFKLVNVATFRLPMNTSSPVVMVAAGTGLAPFVGFIRHRIEQAKKEKLGPCYLVFGCRSPGDIICE